MRALHLPHAEHVVVVVIFEVGFVARICIVIKLILVNNDNMSAKISAVKPTFSIVSYKAS